MAGRRLTAFASLAYLLTAPSSTSARADEVRYYEQGGVTYCETRRTVEERIPQSRIEERTQTVCRERLVTEMRDTVRTYWTPVTEYRWEAFWVGRWNPLAEPYLAYRHVPYTRWERRTEVVKTPVTTRKVVPETRTIRQPVAGWQTVRREVVTRMPVGRAISAGPVGPVEASSLARGEPVGGIRKLESDPPRHGIVIARQPDNAAVRR